MQEFHSLQTVSVLKDSFECLFSSVGGLCQYNPEAPQIYFSLGESVAALGLIFAVFQLSKPIWNLTLKIKGSILKNLIWIFSGLGLICVLIASILPQASIFSFPFNYPIFWEILGFIFFILSPISFLIIASTYRNIFCKKNALNFYHSILFSGLSNSKQEYFESAIDILHLNLDKIGKYAAELQNGTSNEEHNKIACDLINLVLSENKVADHIATSRIDFIFHLIDVIKKNSLTSRTIGIGFEKLVERLFGNTNSYFYQQLEHEGLTLYAPIYDVIFGDEYIIQEFQILAPLSMYFFPDIVKNDERYIQTHLKALSKAISAGGFLNYQISHKIAFALYKIPDYINDLAWIQKDIKNADQKANIRTILMKVEFFLGRDFPELYRNAIKLNKVNDQERNVDKGKGKYSRSLTASYAEVVVEYIGALTRFDNKEMEFHHANSVTDEIQPISNNDSALNCIREIFLEFIWEAIKDNVENGHFPVILRIYLDLMRWNDKTMPQWRKDERKKLVNYINSELAPRLIKKELMANFKDTKESELLPNDIIFDRKKKKFYLVWKDSSKKEYK